MYTCTISFPERLCAVYLRKNIQPLLSRPTHFAHAGLARNVLKNLSTAFPRVVKCCILYILFIFSFNALDKGLNLLLQLKWLEWKNNGAELSTTDIELYNGAEFGQSSGFMLSIVKQLESPWNLATMCSKYFRYQYMSELICITGRISTSNGDKQQSKVADLAKYVHLPEVGTFQVSISVTKSWLFYTKIVIIYLNEYQLCFYKKDWGKNVM